MKIIDYVSIQVFKEETSSQYAKSKVIVNDTALDIVVDGSVLEGCVKVSANRFVLFVTHNCPYEESLSISLIDIYNQQLMDSFWIGIPYNTDTFQALKVVDQSIQFDFLNDKLWNLKISDKPQLSLPFSLNRMIHRKPQIKRYLHIESY